MSKIKIIKGVNIQNKIDKWIESEGNPTIQSTSVSMCTLQNGNVDTIISIVYQPIPFKEMEE